jgi:hypothetical protein
VLPDEVAAAQDFLMRRGAHPIARNRLARILMAGRGAADPAEAIKWHLMLAAGGAGDPELDIFASKKSDVATPPTRPPRNGCRR